MPLFALAQAGGKIRNGVAVIEPPPTIPPSGNPYIKGIEENDFDHSKVQILELSDIQGMTLNARADASYLRGELYEHDVEVISASGDASHATAANAIVDYAAPGPNRYHTITGLYFGYSATPTGGLISVQSPSGVVLFEEPITNAGAGFFPFTKHMVGGIDADMLVTLTNGGSGVTGYVSVEGHKIL